MSINNFILSYETVIIAAGVIDEDYRGVVKVVLFNHSSVDFIVKKGDRIAQLICERIYYPEIQEVKVSYSVTNITYVNTKFLL